MSSPPALPPGGALAKRDGVSEPDRSSSANEPVAHAPRATRAADGLRKGEGLCATLLCVCRRRCSWKPPGPLSKLVSLPGDLLRKTQPQRGCRAGGLAAWQGPWGAEELLAPASSPSRSRRLLGEAASMPLRAVGRARSCNPGLRVSSCCTRGSPPGRAACKAGPLFLPRIGGSMTLDRSHRTSGLHGNGGLSTLAGCAGKLLLTSWALSG